MQFALLGSLTVIDDDGDRVAPAGPRLRVLLAALLLHANTPVSADALAETVWDGSPPPAAATAAHADADKSKKPACRFGAKCYRKNPDHFKEFSHDTAGVNDDDD